MASRGLSVCACSSGLRANHDRAWQGMIWVGGVVLISRAGRGGFVMLSTVEWPVASKPKQGFTVSTVVGLYACHTC